MNQPRMHMRPPILKPPPLLPPHPIPLGCPRALALSALLHASILHWLSMHSPSVFVRSHIQNSASENTVAPGKSRPLTQ